MQWKLVSWKCIRPWRKLEYIQVLLRIDPLENSLTSLYLFSIIYLRKYHMIHREYILVLSSIIFFLCWLIVWFKEFVFRLYVLQLKEYRGDKIIDYISTAEARITLFGKRNIIRIGLLFCFTAGILFRPLLYVVTLAATIYIMWECAVLVKHIYKKTYRKPKRTKRIALLWWLWVLVWCVWYYMYLWWMWDAMALWVFLGLLFSLLLLPVYVRFLWWCTDRIFLKKKKRIFAAATQRMQEYAWCTTIGISWSYGKSSVKLLLAHILSKKYTVAFPPDNINTEMWISTYILHELPQEIEYFVTEFGTYSIGETRLLWDITQHTHGFLTWLNNQHEALFGSLEQAITAETEVIYGVVQRWWVLYVNWESEYVRGVSYPDNLQLVRYGIHESECDARCRIISIDKWITQAIFTYKGHTYTFSTDLIGEHALTNLTWVLACCIDIWLPFEMVSDLTPTLQHMQKTFQHTEVQDRILIDDTYNINQDGVIAWVQAATYFSKPIIAVIDDIPELGTSAHDTHFALWERLASLEVKHIFLTGKEFAEITKKGLINSGFTWVICILQDTWNKRFTQQLYNLSKKSTLLFLWRFTKPYHDYFLSLKE